jgi:FMN reductase
MTVLTIAGLTGSPSAPSRTRLIVQSVLEKIAAQTGAEAHLIDLADLVPDLGICSRFEASPRVEHALRLMESADLLLVGSPVYKGSYTGLFKHLIDLINYPSLLGTPVGLIATGGSDRHALVIEHQLRPLFSFFGAKTLATGVFITDKSISNGWVEEAAVSARLDQLIAEAVHELKQTKPAKAFASG